MPTPTLRDPRTRCLAAGAIGASAGFAATFALPDPVRTTLLALVAVGIAATGLLLLERRRRSGSPDSERDSGTGSDFLQQLLDSIPDPAFVKDGSHRWIAVNRQVCELFGIPREEILGRTDHELFPSNLSTLFMESDRQAIAENALVRTRWRLNRRELRSALAPVRDEFLEGCTHKKPIVGRDGSRHVVGIVRDVSEVVASAEDLRRQRDLAQRKAATTGEFLSTLGHEIRNPLQAMLGASENLVSARLPAEAAESARILHRAGENLLALVDDILELSRLESGTTVVREEPLDLTALVEETVELFSPLVASRGGSLEATLPAARVLATGDGIRIRQILSNLANNAVRYAGHAPIRVELDAGVPGEDGKGLVRIAVVDNGPGFDPGVGADLFRKWHRAAGDRRGSGLGLAIVQESVVLLGGTVRAEGRLGQGAKFVVELPMRLRAPEPPAESLDDTREFAVRAALAQEAPATPPNHDFGGLRVLVAEDNRTNQMVMCRQLEKLNCRTTLAQDGMQALDLMMREGYDLVLMDCQMPVLDGFEACRRWRREESDRRLSRTPILAVTALTLHSEREECLEAGMDEVLAKPLRQADLEAALLRWAPKPAGA